MSYRNWALCNVNAPMLAFFSFSFTIISRNSDIDPRLTPSGTGHMFLRKEQINIAYWNQTYETRSTGSERLLAARFHQIHSHGGPRRRTDGVWRGGSEGRGPARALGKGSRRRHHRSGSHGAARGDSSGRRGRVRDFDRREYGRR